MTNLLETFFIAFEGDSSDVKAAAEEGRAAAADMAEQIDNAGSSAVQAGQDIKSFLMALTGTAAAGLATFSAAVAGLVAAQDKMAETGDVAAGIGSSVQDVAALEQMTIRAGGSVEKTRATLKKLSDSGKGAVENLGDVAQAMERLPEAGKIRLGEELGLDRDMIAELAKGFDHYQQMVTRSKANLPYTEADFRQAREVSHLWNQVKASMTQTPEALTFLSVKMSGLLKEVLTIWRDFTQAPMSDGMRKTLDIAALALENMWKMIKVVGAGIAWVYGTLKDFLPLIAGIGGAIVVALMPLQYLGFGAIIAGIAGLLLVLDDLRGYLAGEDSFIGEFLAEHPKVAAFLHQLGEMFSRLGDAASAAWGVLKDKAGELWEKFKALLPTTDDLSDAVARVTDFLLENKDTLISVAKAAAALLAMWLAYKAKAYLDEATDGGTLKYLIKMIGIISALTWAWQTLGDQAGRVWATIKEAAADIASKLGIDISSLTGGGKPADAASPGDGQPPAASAAPQEVIPGATAAVTQITAANAAPVNGLTSSALSSQTSNTRNTEVNITGPITVQTQATDADGVGKSLGDSLHGQVQQTFDHFDNGVLF